MATARTALVVTGVLAVLATALPARSSTLDQYLKIRRESNVDRHLTYSQVQSDLTAHIHKVLELRGSANGFIRNDGDVSFLLTLADKSILQLKAPAGDIPLVTDPNHQMMRILVRVGEDTSQNVAPLEILAIAYDAEVTEKENEAAAREAAASRRTQQRRYTDRQTTRIASRSFQQAPQSTSSQNVPSGSISALAARNLSPEAQAIYPAYKQYIYRCNPRLTAQELDTITVSILHFSQIYQLDPRLVIAMIIAESDFDPRSTSHKGAMGLGQIMPDEARDLHLNNPYDPVQNVMGAVNLLRNKLDHYRAPTTSSDKMTWDQLKLALAAYNAGMGAVRRYGGIPPYRETQGYVKRVVGIYQQLIGAR